MSPRKKSRTRTEDLENNFAQDLDELSDKQQYENWRKKALQCKSSSEKKMLLNGMSVFLCSGKCSNNKQYSIETESRSCRFKVVGNKVDYKTYLQHWACLRDPLFVSVILWLW